jgi:hypothetical protein
MPTESDEIFFLEAEQLRPLPVRSMRAGLFGRSLEDALQMLLQRYPQVIPGRQIDPASEDPPRFVLLRREMPVGGWSLDHLYVDQRGILTLVETKLIQNPESRREVIGQVIEYAANTNESWAYGRARQYATEFWSKEGRELNEVLLEEFGEDLDIESFWGIVEENLKDGRIRLIIAADELRAEVRRMIEYLNREMQNAEVLGLELKCYGQESTPLVLVPRLVGQTRLMQPGVTGPVLWTVDKLSSAFEGFENEEGRRLQKVLDWAVSNRFLIEGRTQFPAFGLRGKGKERILTVSSSGRIYLFFEERRYLGGAEERDVLVNELKALEMLDPDIDPGEVVSGRTSTRKLSGLDDNEFARLLDVLSRYCG